MTINRLNFLNYFSFIIWEVIIIWLLILSFNNFIGNSEETIKGDGVGYYDYLPSIFIHKDLIRKDYQKHKNFDEFSRIDSIGVYVNYKEHLVNKYPSGTSLLLAPFFITTFILSPESDQHNGYERPYQKTVFYAAIFYLFLSLIFLKKLLQLYQIKKSSIIITQFLLVLATSLTNYTSFDASYSHVYSLFAITAFLYFIKSYWTTKNFKDFLFASFFIGLIIILRQINVLIILFIPFISGSWENFKSGIIQILNNKKVLLSGVLIAFAVISVQLWLWYLQTGEYVIYSYQNEGFNFLTPAFIDILFSYKKGLFVYTPVVFLAMFGLIRLIVQKKYFLFTSWSFFFLILTYVLSSWWSWYYGCSYGLRAYIDFYVIFFILLAFLLDGLTIKLKLLLSIPIFLTIPLNLIQTFQYKEFILHWIDMDKDKYWKIFLKQDDKYKGLVWKTNYDYSQYKILHTASIGDINAVGEQTVYQEKLINIADFNKVDVVQVIFDNDFSEENKSQVMLYIQDSETQKLDYLHYPFLIHFANKQLNQYQKGLYNFAFNPINSENQTLYLKVLTNGELLELKNLKIRFLNLKD